jgi:hypothetical protein
MIQNMLQNYAPFGISIWQVICNSPVELVVTILGSKIGLDKILIGIILAFLL